jgi:hypothetical protein
VKLGTVLIVSFWLIVSDGWAQRYTRARQWEEKAGTWQLCVDGGTTRYMGDLCEPWDLAHLRLGATLGTSVQYRLSDRFSARADLRVYYIYGDQAYTRVAFNNLRFQAVNPDCWVGLQFDLLHQDTVREQIPYVFAGAGVTYMTPTTLFDGYRVDLAKAQTEGVAYNQLVHMERNHIGLEISYTHCLSDYLDDVSGVYPDYATLKNPFGAVLSDRAAEIGNKPNAPGAQRGNNAANDGYYLFTARFTHTISTHRHRNMRQNRR